MLYPTSEYTLELRFIADDPNFKLFDFSYPFYEELERANFESLFIQHYYFHEIGFETIQRFKNRLQHKLNLIYPIYKKLYETELACKDINFLYNKDLKETTQRELTAINDGTNSAKSSNTGNQDYKESNIENGNASLTLANGSLTNVNNTSTNSDQNSSTDSHNNLNQNETVTLLSQGNIGVTTSADLVSAWRSILQDLTRQIIENELHDLFLKIY